MNKIDRPVHSTLSLRAGEKASTLLPWWAFRGKGEQFIIWSRLRERWNPETVRSYDLVPVITQPEQDMKTQHSAKIKGQR